VYGGCGQHVGDDRAVAGVPCAGLCRHRLRSATLAAVGVALSLAGSECALDQKALGESCLKGEDCLSGICADRACVVAPPLLDAEPPRVDGTSEIEAATDSAADSAKDTSTSASDGAADVSLDQGSTDATLPREAEGGGSN